jgi:CheY-like chemotaxis protein
LAWRQCWFVEEEILTLAQSFLEEQGHKTLSAANADEGLAILTKPEAVDALFVDIVLNGDTQAGLELAKRAVELNPRLKVVYSTGLSVTDDMKALFVPGSAVLEKPYTVDQLLTSLSVPFQMGLAFEIHAARICVLQDALQGKETTPLTMVASTALYVRQRSRPPCASRTFVSNSFMAFVSDPQLSKRSCMGWSITPHAARSRVSSLGSRARIEMSASHLPARPTIVESSDSIFPANALIAG